MSTAFFKRALRFAIVVAIIAMPFLATSQNIPSSSISSGRPTSLPPSGAAGGDLTGTYPNPSLAASIATSVSWSGTQTRAGISVDAQTTVTVTGAAYQFTATTPYLLIGSVTGSPGTLTITSNPVIVAGSVAGQRLSILNATSTVITLTNGNGITSNSSADIVISSGRWANFVWIAAVSAWCESDAQTNLGGGAYGVNAVANGGTSKSSWTAHTLLAGNGTNAPAELPVGTSGQVLVGATGADPSFLTVSRTCTLDGASPAVCTVAVRAGCIPTCGYGSAPNVVNGLWCAVSGTTLTATDTNGSTAAVNIICP